MPPAKKHNKKKTNKKKQRKRKLPPLGYPIQTVGRVRMGGSFTLDGQAGTFATHRISCNYPAQPDPDGASSRQPRHYGVFSRIYNQGRVLGAKLILRPTGPGSTQINTMMFGVMINDTGSLSAPNTQISDLVEDGRLFGKYRRMRHDIAGTKPIVMKWSCKRIGDVKNGNDDVTDFNPGNVYQSASPPTRREYFCCYAGRAGLDVLDPQPINFLYTVEYIIKFWDFIPNLAEG